ncbi:ribonuclease E/G [Thermodesulfobacteriota bacterium]
MKKIMLINAVESEELRIAFVSDNMLEGFHIDTTSGELLEGNIYKGVVERIEPSLQACFVNFGSVKNGFLPVDSIHPEYYNKIVETSKDRPHPPIEKVIKKGQELLVEVLKEMPGRKGAHLSTYLSFAGRYIVLTPGRTINGVSRKIESEDERQRLKSIMNKMKFPEGVGYIIRTVAAGQNKRELSKDLNRLLRLWKTIKKGVVKIPPYTLVHKEQDLCLRTLRDYYNSEVSEVIVDDRKTYSKIKEYMKIISPRDSRKVKPYKEKRPIFDKYGIEDQIESIYLNQVKLKSGGSIVFGITEALISIDVNSGRTKSGKDVETMAFNTNLEAAVEAARQLRMRDLGGLIVIDFIDMRDKKHIRTIEKTLREELKKDRAKTDISSISKFGLLELSRQRLSPSLESKTYQTCEHCKGRGMVIAPGAAAVSFLRRIQKGVLKGKISGVVASLPYEVAEYIQNKKRNELVALEKRYGIEIDIKSDHSLPPGGGDLEFVKADSNNK